MIIAERRKVEHTGISGIGWRLGYGYVSEERKIKYEVWCVLENGRVIAECRSKAIARRIASELSTEGD